MKFALPLFLLLALSLAGCNTIENRRSVYRTTKVEGPYTRSLDDGSWKHPKSVDEQYAEAERKRKQTKGAPAPEPAPNTTVQPEPAL